MKQADQQPKAYSLVEAIEAYIDEIEDEWYVKNAVNSLQRASGGILLGGGEGLWKRLEREMRIAGECAPPEAEQRAAAQSLASFIVDYYGLETDDDDNRSEADRPIDGYDWASDVDAVEGAEVESDRSDALGLVQEDSDGDSGLSPESGAAGS